MSSDSCVVTLCDKSYLLGGLAFVNSLANSDFNGHLVIFTTSKEARDFFANTLTHYQSKLPFSSAEVRLRTCVGHPKFKKPDFLLELTNDFNMTYFFDPDIVILKAWGNFKFWSSAGVSLVADKVWHPMNALHLKRKAWMAACFNIKRDFRPLDFYVNSGFIGIPKQHALLLDIWRETIEAFLPQNLKTLESNLGVLIQDCFNGGDQDPLNAALHLSDMPLTVLGPDEGMGFGRLQTPYMLHAAGIRKPWRGSAIWDGLRHGRQPANVHRRFLDFVREPIPVYPLWREWLGRADYWGARAVTSVIRR
jgi:hypothetical protein